MVPVVLSPGKAREVINEEAGDWGDDDSSEVAVEALEAIVTGVLLQDGHRRSVEESERRGWKGVYKQIRSVAEPRGRKWHSLRNTKVTLLPKTLSKRQK